MASKRLPTFELHGHTFILKRAAKPYVGGYLVMWRGIRVVGPGAHMLGGCPDACAKAYKGRIHSRFPTPEALNEVLAHYSKVGAP